MCVRNIFGVGVTKLSSGKCSEQLFDHQENSFHAKMALRAVLCRCVNNGLGVNKCGLVRFASDSSSSDITTIPKEIPVRRNADIYVLDSSDVRVRRTSKSTITVSAVEDVGAVASIPEEHIKTRTVRIYQPPKNAMQSGTNNINYWQIDFDTRERWENPLIGWTSTGDPHSNIKVDFASKEEAIAHCEKMGWQYFIQKPNPDNPKPRSYGQNFAWNKRTRVSTK